MCVRYLLLFFIILFAGCNHPRKVNTSFYYWKTVYKQNPAETRMCQQLHSTKMHIRIMDIDMSDDGQGPVPVSPIVFEQKLPDGLQAIPVVYIINNVLKVTPKAGLPGLANKIVRFVDAKISQAGKKTYNELQIDCDWTAQTRDNYFYLLGILKGLLNGKTISVTLRLHQIKNTVACGVPPVSKVLLMCYNMGNLRKYGPQNSIIDMAELKKYLGDNLTRYPAAMDIGLPLFSWAVAFRDERYIGIARQINFESLNNPDKFIAAGNNLYRAKTDMPAYGLQQNDVVRWEAATIASLRQTAQYLAPKLSNGNTDVVYFHLDEDVLKNYTYDELENVAALLR